MEKERRGAHEGGGTAAMVAFLLSGDITCLFRSLKSARATLAAVTAELQTVTTMPSARTVLEKCDFHDAGLLGEWFLPPK